MSALVIDSHPHIDSLCASLARTYAEAHGDATVLALRDLDFDPNLHFGYNKRQDLEPDLERAWQQIVDADHVVLVTPVWWGSVPALLKGFFDRVLLPGRAFEIRPSGMPTGLLKGRTGRLIVTTDSPWWYLKLMGDTTVKHLRRSTLRYCGIRPVPTTRIGAVKGSTEAKRERWLAEAADQGRREAAKNRRPAASKAADTVG
ncbi:NAD(P)H-dependent oxidoreductase [Streptomyces sp. NPDC001027]|uniref:NAD(P)H-dependent oxidoreductase n=1 Tax=Streptomyces sp. NPDC001027 TaxID=3154771 RepID=UPI00331D2C55